MSDVFAPNAGRPAAPAVEVCVDGGLLRRIPREAAEQLLARGWAEWRGRGRRRYLELTERAPLSSLFGVCGKFGTRAIRADGSGQRNPGQLLGDPKSHLEFRPTTL